MFVNWLDRKLYPGFKRNWDDLLFREAIRENLQPNHHILDVGAGAGIVSQMNFRSDVERVCGIDPDKRVVDNPYLHEGKVAMAEQIPFPADSFDLVFADNVLEHLENPQEVFAEVQRVLKPGGLFLVKTPNKLHYMPLIARLTPHWFHRAFNRMRGRESEDTFPTRYRANSVRDLKNLANATALEMVEARLIEGRPEYLRFSSVTYVLGWLYERLVNRLGILAGLRVLLIGKFRKPLVSTVNKT